MKRRAGRSKSDAWMACMFLLPSFLGFVVFYLIPILGSLIFSFTKWNMSSSFDNLKFTGLGNYTAIFADKWFVDSMRNSLVFTVTTVLLGVGVSLILAVMMKSLKRFRSPLKTMFFLPYISSTVAVAIVWMILLQPKQGPVNMFLRSLGVADPPTWLISMQWALPALIAMYIWQNLGYNMIIYLAGLTGISPELYEAAEIDGAGTLNKFFKITVPMISPITFFLVIMGIINSFKVFDQVKVLTDGGPGTATATLALYIYRSAFRYYDVGKSSAAAWAMFVIIFIVTMIQWRGQKKWVSYE